MLIGISSTIDIPIYLLKTFHDGPSISIGYINLNESNQIIINSLFENDVCNDKNNIRLLLFDDTNNLFDYYEMDEKLYNKHRLFKDFLDKRHEVSIRFSSSSFNPIVLQGAY